MLHYYRDYQPIAAIDLTRSAHPVLWLIMWDPTESMATRPLAIQKDGTWYCYGLDLTRNVCELFSNNGYIRTTYDYAPYGGVTANGSVTQPLQWSSEVNDAELALVYYNYRHYNPADGRWINRDPFAENEGYNLYAFGWNNPINILDLLWLSNWTQDYLSVGGSCSNLSKGIEWALVDGSWKQLYPGESTSWCEDCDGMTCGGAFYAVNGGIFGGDNAVCKTPGQDSDDYAKRRWVPGVETTQDRIPPGRIDESYTGPHRGAGKLTPPNYKYDAK